MGFDLQDERNALQFRATASGDIFVNASLEVEDFVTLAGSAELGGDGTGSVVALGHAVPLRDLHAGRRVCEQPPGWRPGDDRARRCPRERGRCISPDPNRTAALELNADWRVPNTNGTVQFSVVSSSGDVTVGGGLELGGNMDVVQYLTRQS